MKLQKTRNVGCGPENVSCNRLLEAVSSSTRFQVKEENRGNGPIKTRQSPLSVESGAGIMM